jgi:hypothetical protein
VSHSPALHSEYEVLFKSFWYLDSQVQKWSINYVIIKLILMHHFLDDNNRIFHNINDTNLQLIFLEIIFRKVFETQQWTQLQQWMISSLSLYHNIIWWWNYSILCLFFKPSSHTLDIVTRKDIYYKWKYAKIFSSTFCCALYRRYNIYTYIIRLH